MLAMALTSQAQLKMFRVEKDSIPFFRGFAVSFDLVGPAMESTKLPCASICTTSGFPSSRQVSAGLTTRKTK